VSGPLSINRMIDRVRARLAERLDNEHSQAMARIGLVFAFGIYLFVACYFEAVPLPKQGVLFVTLLLELVVGCLIFLSILRHPATNPTRRIVGVVADYSTMAVTLGLSGPVGAPMYAALLWVTVGNGLRYGTRYLYACVLLSVGVLAYVWFNNSYWQSNPFMSGAMTLAAMAVPLYLTSLLRAHKVALQQADRASQAKTRFMAQMSHEFRTPLNAIMGMSQLLMTSRLPRENHESAELIHTSAQSLLMMVEDVLNVSAIESGKVRIHTQDFNLHAMLRRLEQVFRPQAKILGLYLTIIQDPMVPKLVHGDQEHLNQVLLNLMHNALKFTAKGGVTLHVAPAGLFTGGIRLRFSVRDTGIGVAEEDRERIFKPFEQVDSGTNRHFGGVGLGVTIARTLVEIMGGEIGVSDNHGGGAHFWIDVPLGLVKPVFAEAQNVEVASTTDDPLSDGSNVISIDDPYIRHRATVPSRCVLVVDDQATNRILMEHLLKRAGHTVLVVEDGAAALDLVARKMPDLITLDLHMPGMNGLDVMSQLRVMEASSRIKTPVIMLSADATKEALRAMEASGAFAAISKPIDPLVLLDAIARATQHRPDGDAAPASSQCPLATRRNALADLAQIDSTEEFLTGYVEQAWQDIGRSIERLRNHPNQPDPHEMLEALHAIRGVARNIAADALATACTCWMELNRYELLEQHRTLPAAVAALVAEARVEVRSQLERLIKPPLQDAAGE